MRRRPDTVTALTDSVLTAALPMINDRLTDDRLDRGAALITIMAGRVKGWPARVGGCCQSSAAFCIYQRDCTKPHAHYYNIIDCDNY